MGEARTWLGWTHASLSPGKGEMMDNHLSTAPGMARIWGQKVEEDEAGIKFENPGTPSLQVQCCGSCWSPHFLQPS